QLREPSRRAFHHRPASPGRRHLARGRRLRTRLAGRTRRGRAGGGRGTGAAGAGRPVSTEPVLRQRRGAAPGLASPVVGSSLERDFQRFKRGLPRDFPAHVRETYGIDLAARYLGNTLPHPIGKGSGQLSLNAGQLEDDAAAGLAFVVLRTVIAEDEDGAQAMAAWAIHESKMKVERRSAGTGREGWTVTWKGRGWDRRFRR